MRGDNTELLRVSTPRSNEGTPRSKGQGGFASPQAGHDIEGPRHAIDLDREIELESSARRRRSIESLDMSAITAELLEVNPFKKGEFDSGQTDVVMCLEITNSGKTDMRSMRLREVLDYVNSEAKNTDKRGNGFGYTRMKVGAGRGIFPSSTSRNSISLSGIVQTQQINQAQLLAGEGLTPESESTDSGKNKISAVNPLRLRDLRRLENMSSESSLLVRWHAVVLSLDPIRAIIMSDKLLLFVPDGADDLLQVVENHMLEWVHAQSTPLDSIHEKNKETGTGTESGSGYEEEENGYAQGRDREESDDNRSRATNSSTFESFEAHAYDALLTTVNSLLTQEYNKINLEVQGILRQFKQKGCILSIDAQEKMRMLKNQLSEISGRIDSFQRALDDVVEDDEGMALMNLNLLSSNPNLYQYPLSAEILGTHEEVEELLENYLNDFNSTESKLEYLKAQMQSAEELVSLRLDTARNQLLVVNTFLAVLACAIAFGSYFTGVFGMNLDNTQNIQFTPHLFAIIFGSTIAFIIIFFSVVIWYLRQTGILPTNAEDMKNVLNSFI